jgi:hypothetical protein
MKGRRRVRTDNGRKRRIEPWYVIDCSVLLTQYADQIPSPHSLIPKELLSPRRKRSRSSGKRPRNPLRRGYRKTARPVIRNRKDVWALLFKGPVGRLWALEAFSIKARVPSEFRNVIAGRISCKPHTTNLFYHIHTVFVAENAIHMLRGRIDYKQCYQAAVSSSNWFPNGTTQRVEQPQYAMLTTAIARRYSSPRMWTCSSSNI